jgi:hypothetical protein
MCVFCVRASELAGRPYMCRPCWRRLYVNGTPVRGGGRVRKPKGK